MFRDRRHAGRLLGEKVRGLSLERPVVLGLPRGGVVVAADGVESRLGAWAGLDTQLPPADTMVCAQYLLAGIDWDPGCLGYWIDDDLTPGGYAWVFPKGEGRANVGLGLQAGLGRETALACLQRFVEREPALSAGCAVTLVAGNVPVALPCRRLVTAGLLLAGDAARQVDPLTGGGILNAMLAGPGRPGRRPGPGLR